MNVSSAKADADEEGDVGGACKCEGTLGVTGGVLLGVVAVDVDVDDEGIKEVELVTNADVEEKEEVEEDATGGIGTSTEDPSTNLPSTTRSYAKNTENGERAHINGTTKCATHMCEQCLL